MAEPLRPLTDEALEARIRQLPKAPLTHAAIKRMSRNLLRDTMHVAIIELRHFMV